MYLLHTKRYKYKRYELKKEQNAGVKKPDKIKHTSTSL